MIEFLPTVDSDEIAEMTRRKLSLPRHVAQALGASAVVAIRAGSYFDDDGNKVDWAKDVQYSIDSKVTISPTDQLPTSQTRFEKTRVQITNETTLEAGQRLVKQGKRPLALNFANGIQPGGGFLSGALAQEECLCRSSALFGTLENDPMYEFHRNRPMPDSTDWAILSPEVPIFRTDVGAALHEPWQLSFISCAAPVAYRMDRGVAAQLLSLRIKRVLSIAHTYGYRELVLGAWGCGAFGNDPCQTAESFRDELETNFADAFSEIIFAITDWSRERRFLGPFRDVFC